MHLHMSPGRVRVLKLGPNRKSSDVHYRTHVELLEYHYSSIVIPVDLFRLSVAETAP